VTSRLVDYAIAFGYTPEQTRSIELADARLLDTYIEAQAKRGRG
jgi:hypothetical protein